MEDYNLIDSTWLEGFDALIHTQQKRKIERVKFEQKELLVDFITENPEMITHSSTRESEKALWDELVTKLNQIKPEKKGEFWKNYWNKWINSLEDRVDNSLTLLDYKLKKFLKNVGFKTGENEEKPHVSSLNNDEVEKKLNEVKKETVKNKLELDQLEYNIVKLKKELIELKSQVKEKRKLNVRLDQKKNSLIKRKKILMEETRRCPLNNSVDDSINESY